MNKTLHCRLIHQLNSVCSAKRMLLSTSFVNISKNVQGKQDYYYSVGYRMLGLGTNTFHYKYKYSKNAIEPMCMYCTIIGGCYVFHYNYTAQRV